MSPCLHYPCIRLFYLHLLGRETNRANDGKDEKQQQENSRPSVMKLALAWAAVVLLCHRGVLMSQCLPLGKCTLAYWRQTPWHIGGHLPEETSWGLSRNSDTWERTKRKWACQRDAGKPREREVRIEGMMTDKERTWSESKITLHGCLESFVDLG